MLKYLLLFVIPFTLQAQMLLPIQKKELQRELQKLKRRKTLTSKKDVWGKGAHLIKLNCEWEDTDKKDKATYLSKEDRQIYKLRFENGKVYDSSGVLFNTRGRGDGSAQYVMDRHGDMYATTIWRRLKFEHHSLVAGEPVLSAGTLIVHRGRIKRINDISAQYPSLGYYSLTRVISKLKNYGINTSSIKVIYHNDFSKGGQHD